MEELSSGHFTMALLLWYQNSVLIAARLLTTRCMLDNNIHSVRCPVTLGAGASCRINMLNMLARTASLRSTRCCCGCCWVLPRQQQRFTKQPAHTLAWHSTEVEPVLYRWAFQVCFTSTRVVPPNFLNGHAVAWLLAIDSDDAEERLLLPPEVLEAQPHSALNLHCCSIATGGTLSLHLLTRAQRRTTNR